MAGVSLRIALIAASEIVMPPVNDLTTTSEVPLVDIIDRLLERGVVLAGGATIAVAGVDLIELRLNVLLASVDALERRAPREVVP